MDDPDIAAMAYHFLWEKPAGNDVPPQDLNQQVKLQFCQHKVACRPKSAVLSALPPPRFALSAKKSLGHD